MANFSHRGARGIAKQYAVLGLKQGASQREIDAKYRTLALEYHPDRNGDPVATAKFKQATEAYDQLRVAGQTKVRRRTTSLRPKKPYKKFPLYAHPTGNWAKKIRGKLHYFGRWGRIRKGEMERLPADGWQAALALYNAQAEALHAGRTPRGSSDGLTIKELCNRYLTAKQRRMEAVNPAMRLSPRTFYEVRQATDIIMGLGSERLVDDVGPDDFAGLWADMSKKWGPVRLGKFVGMIQSVFKYAEDNRLIDRPVTFGTEFRKPDKSVLRKNKTAAGKKLFAAKEIRALLDGTTIKEKGGKAIKVPGATPQLSAAILLGINAGLGNSDVSGLQHANLDLDNGWLDYPRPKTGLPRRAPLWDVTIKALRVAIVKRPAPKDAKLDGNCAFLNRAGRRMVQSTETSHSDYVSTQFRKLLHDMGINGRKGLNFYSLRHTFASVGLQTGDRDAVRALMGHAAHDMLAAYDETGPSDERLLAVAEHVRQWLFEEGGAK